MKNKRMQSIVRPVPTSLLRAVCNAALMVMAVSPGIASAADQKMPSSRGLGVQDEVIVEASRYTKPQTTTATKTDTPLRDVPQSASVVSEELIHDQSMRSMADVVRYVPGVSMAQGEGHRDAPTLRGNNTTADFFVDGMRDDVQYYRDLYNAERVEVFKGPNAMIFGRGGGGGLINRVTKQADGARRGELSLQAGSHDNKRAAADVGGSVNDALSLRLNAMYEDSESFRDFFEIERYGINPTANLAVSENTRIQLSYEYLNDDRLVDRGVPSSNGRPANVRRSTFFGNPDLSFSEAMVSIASIGVEHDFAPNLTLRNRTQYADYDKFYSNVHANGAVSNGSVRLEAYQSGTDRQNVFNQTDLIWQTTLGSTAHTVLVGTEFGKQDTRNLRNDASAPGSVPIGNTVSSAPQIFDRATQDNDVDVRVAAVYLQDQIELSKQFQVIAGVRVDSFDIEFDNRLPAVNRQFDRQDDLVSPRLGLIYKPAEPISVYASYSVSYLPSSGDQFSALTAEAAAFKPEEFENIEVGVKWDLNPRLAFTAAVYQLDRTNTRAPAPTGNTLVLTGAQRSEGVELGLSGAITDRWDIVAGVAFQNAEITRRTQQALQGREVALVPDQQFSLWNTYRVTPKWRFGLGVTYQSDVFTSFSNAVELESFTRVDGAVFFTVSDRFEAQLNVENLFDERYFGTAHNDNNITPGSPTAVRLGVTSRF